MKNNSLKFKKNEYNNILIPNFSKFMKNNSLMFINNQTFLKINYNNNFKIKKYKIKILKWKKKIYKLNLINKNNRHYKIKILYKNY